MRSKGRVIALSVSVSVCLSVCGCKITTCTYLTSRMKIEKSKVVTLRPNYPKPCLNFNIVYCRSSDVATILIVISTDSASSVAANSARDKCSTGHLRLLLPEVQVCAYCNELLHFHLA